MSERRAPVQGERHSDPQGSRPAGTVTWDEHLKAWENYHKRYPKQSAERIAQRSGFSYWEMTELLGHEPRTWQANESVKQ